MQTMFLVLHSPVNFVPFSPSPGSSSQPAVLISKHKRCRFAWPLPGKVHHDRWFKILCEMVKIRLHNSSYNSQWTDKLLHVDSLSSRHESYSVQIPCIRSDRVQKMKIVLANVRFITISDGSCAQTHQKHCPRNQQLHHGAWWRSG